MMPQKFGWFSQKSATLYGTVIYTDADGKEVECTEVTRSPIPPTTSLWEDMKPKGPVFDFVRRGNRKGSKEMFLGSYEVSR